jgi:integrase
MPYKVKRRGKEIWRGQVRVNGQLTQKQFATKAKAEEWEEAMRREQTPPTLSTSSPTTVTDEPTLHQLGTAYLTYAQRFSSKVRSSKRTTIKRFLADEKIDPLGPISAVTPEVAMAYLTRQFVARSGRAANNDRKDLGAMWNHGADFLDRFPTALKNPFHLTPPFPAHETPHYVPHEEDFWKVVEAAQGQDKVLLLTFLYTAGRRSEIYRLRVEDDLDFERRRIRLGTCKTRSGGMEYEWIPMVAELEQTIRAWLMVRPFSSEYLFVQPWGRYAGEPYTENRGFPQDLCAKAEVRAFGCHGIRGLTASILADLNAPLKEIQSILRHKKITTTDRYIRKLTGNDSAREHLERLDRGRSQSVPSVPRGVPKSESRGLRPRLSVIK